MIINDRSNIFKIKYIKVKNMKDYRKIWLERIGQPTDYEFEHTLTLERTFEGDGFDGELYVQANGVGTTQRLMMLFPKNITEPVPCVAVPFYFPEAMLGYDPFSGEVLENYTKIAMMYDLVRRGYAVASADSYHLTYIRSDLERNAFTRWKLAAEALNSDHPQWTGIGKLVFDTKLMIDALCADKRTDSSRVGIAGHSLGGKMAFYTGCLDERVKVILASDFGIGWDQTNWRDIWYWGDKVDALIAEGLDHSSLLGSAAPKPMCLLAGKYDNDDSRVMMESAFGYEGAGDVLCVYNHATGHRPPTDVLERGYDFIDKYLK